MNGPLDYTTEAEAQERRCKMGQSTIEIAVDAAIKHLEKLVNTSYVGPARAYFEIPTGKESFIRAVYKTYILQAPTMPEVINGLKAVIEEEIRSVKHRSAMTCLVWRMQEKIEVSVEENRIIARTRIVVLPPEEED